MPTDDPYRLPRAVRPQRYDLELAPDLDAATFRGTVTITVEVAEVVDLIVLNSLGLDITDALVRGGGEELRAEVELDPDHERAMLRLPAELPVGAAEVHLAFRGTLDDQLVGFYRSTFTADGTEHAVAVTQFESTHARRAFPCFDEPDMKAIFSITLDVGENLLAVSNASEVDRGPIGDGLVRIRFADTIPMSTYLVAFVVGPLEVTDVRMVQGMAGPIPLRVVYPPGSARLCAFALEVADAGLCFLERYYELPYPGDKVDLVAVPDFAFGAMENLGCITFREVLLLVDPERATQQELQHVADVINHELAHMWFGDLVTMGWWNGIWLNEAFATFMEVMASDDFMPEWDTWTSFGLARAAAFDTDALSSTRPIEFPVRSPADAEAMFDVLTYEKGASVVRMLEQYLGAEPFRTGIAAYLRAHAYGNTGTTDLWDALEASTGEPVRRIMDAWILRGGHPTVTVTPTDTGVRLSQRPARYADADPARPTAAGGDGTWPVPIVLTARVGGDVEQRRALLEETTDVDLGAPPTMVRLNTGGNGFFRTALPESLRTAAAAGEEATALERFVLVDDTWAGVLAADVSTVELARLLRLASWRETDPSVWRRISGAVRDLRRLWGLEHRELVAELALEVAGPPLAHVDAVLDATIGADGGRWQDVRGVLVSLLGTVGGDGPTQLLAHEVFRAEGTPDNPGTADSAVRAAALDVVAASGGREDHLMIEQRWRAATTPQDRIRYLYALADTTGAELFDHTLDLAITEVRSQDAAFVLRRALSHPDLSERAWEHVSAHWAAILDRLPSSALPRMLEGIRGVTDRALADRITAFLVEHPLPSGQRTAAQHIERMWVTVAAATRARDELGAGTGR